MPKHKPVATQPWESTLTAYFTHQGVNIYQIRENLDDARRIINALPLRIQRAVTEELNKWGRDDFVELSGYLAALETVKKTISTCYWLQDRKAGIEP